MRVSKCVDEIPRHFLEARLRADQLRELRPFALHGFPCGHILLVLDDFLDVLVQCVDLLPIDVQLRQPALVVDRHRRLVVHGVLDVVDRDVIAEDAARVAILQRDRRAGEADERRLRQRVAHVLRIAEDIRARLRIQPALRAVLAAMRLVGDHGTLLEQNATRPKAFNHCQRGGEHIPLVVCDLSQVTFQQC